jgi:hypothetical protein
MPSSIPAWAHSQPKDDWDEARKAYYRRRAGEITEIQIRQRLRRIRVQEIEAAPVVIVDGEPTVLGEPWFNAWLTTATFLALEGRFKEIRPPREWLAEKLQQDLEE